MFSGCYCHFVTFQGEPAAAITIYKHVGIKQLVLISLLKPIKVYQRANA